MFSDFYAVYCYDDLQPVHSISALIFEIQNFIPA